MGMFRLRWLLGSLLFKNMIKNGNFEEGEKYWLFVYGGITAEDKYSGKYSAKVGQVIQDYEELASIYDYYFRVRAKPVDPANPVFYIEIVGNSIVMLRADVDGWSVELRWPERDSAQILHVRDLGRGWQEVLVKFRLSSETVEYAKSVRYSLEVTAYTPTGVPKHGWYYVDDFYLSTVPPPRFPLVSLLLGV